MFTKPPLNRCDKCTSFVKVYEFNGRLLGKACGCYYEEEEKLDARIESDRLAVEEVRSLEEATQEHPQDTSQ